MEVRLYSSIDSSYVSSAPNNKLSYLEKVQHILGAKLRVVYRLKDQWQALPRFRRVFLGFGPLQDKARGNFPDQVH